ncbi:MAG TPA: CBS domain-containing protein [Casimicrobiaceae bacterium]
MDQEPPDNRAAPPLGPSSAPAGAPAHRSTPKDHFLQLMFFQASHESTEPQAEAARALATGPYTALRHLKTWTGDRYTLPLPNAAPVRLDSPAIEVMTDLRRTGAVTVGPDALIDEANRTMHSRRVRALFVVDEARGILGILTATDILGERPIQFAQSRGIRHHEVSVRDIMTTAERLELLDIRDIERARVGDLVATLKFAGRQHALAVEAGERNALSQKTVCGIFSVTQIARQLGIPPQQTHDIAQTFAEIEAVISG